jgi:TetR/AcrR family transcriptional regulator, acrAB operon repressor
MRRTQFEADQTRQSLLDAALTVFSREGYDAARLEDIAAAAGVTRGAVYHHFESKAGLYTALVVAAQQQGGQAVQQAIAAGGTFMDICRRVLVNSLNLVAGDPRFRAVMALTLHPTPAGLPHPAGSGQAQVEQVAGFFRMGLEQHALRPGLDPLTAARAFLAYQNGLILLWLAEPGAFSLSSEAEALADAFLRGLAPGE